MRNPIQHPASLIKEELERRRCFRKRLHSPSIGAEAIAKGYCDFDKWPGHEADFRKWIKQSATFVRKVIQQYRENLEAI